MTRPLFIFAILILPLITEGKFVFEQDRISIKASPTDEMTEARFSFKNEGEAPIEILRIKPSCGCTIAELDKKVYRPGESGEIKTVFKHEQKKGRVHNTIAILTDEPSSALYKLQLSVDIPILISAKPRFLLWRKDETLIPKGITLEATSDETISNITVHQDNPGFRIETETVVDEKKYVLEVTPPEATTFAQCRMTVDILFSSGLKRTYRVYARVQ